MTQTFVDINLSVFPWIWSPNTFPWRKITSVIWLKFQNKAYLFTWSSSHMSASNRQWATDWHRLNIDQHFCVWSISNRWQSESLYHHCWHSSLMCWFADFAFNVVLFLMCTAVVIVFLYSNCIAVVLLNFWYISDFLLLLVTMCKCNMYKTIVR